MRAALKLSQRRDVIEDPEAAPMRGDHKVDYGTVMRVMGRLSAAGFRRVALVTEGEQGS